MPLFVNGLDGKLHFYTAGAFDNAVGALGYLKGAGLTANTVIKADGAGGVADSTLVDDGSSVTTSLPLNVFGDIYIGKRAGTDTNLVIGRLAATGLGAGAEYNTVLGYNALRLNVAGDQNVAIGSSALYRVTNAANVAVGYNAGLDASFSQSVIIGAEAYDGGLGYSVNGTVAIGYRAMSAATIRNCDSNVAIGTLAGDQGFNGGFNVFVGREAGEGFSSGLYNVFLGYQAGHSNGGNYNIAIGATAFANNGSGGENVAIGYQSCFPGVGNDNVCVGYWAGRFTNAGGNPNSFSNCILMGYDTRVVSNGEDQSVVIGYLGRSNGSNTVTLGNSSNLGNYLWGDLYLQNALDTIQIGGVQVVKAQEAALTAQLTTVTFTAPSTPDYSVTFSSAGSAFGFGTQDEARTFASVVANLQTRVAELETRLQNHGLIA